MTLPSNTRLGRSTVDACAAGVNGVDSTGDNRSDNGGDNTGDNIGDNIGDNTGDNIGGAQNAYSASNTVNFVTLVFSPPSQSMLVWRGGTNLPSCGV
jgi:hypothetical protein